MLCASAHVLLCARVYGPGKGGRGGDVHMAVGREEGLSSGRGCALVAAIRLGGVEFIGMTHQLRGGGVVAHLDVHHLRARQHLCVHIVSHPVARDMWQHSHHTRLVVCGAGIGSDGSFGSAVLL